MRNVKFFHMFHLRLKIKEQKVKKKLLLLKVLMTADKLHFYGCYVHELMFY